VKIKPIHIALIVQSGLLVILLIAWISKPGPTLQEKINYDRITEDFDKRMSLIKLNLEIIRNENLILTYKVDSMRSKLPDYKRGLDKICLLYTSRAHET